LILLRARVSMVSVRYTFSMFFSVSMAWLLKVES
jgi:hypothetical protein